MLLMGPATLIPLMVVAVLLLNALIAPRMIATPRTCASEKNLATYEACSLPVKPSWSAIPVAMKEFAISGILSPAEITPTIGQH